MARFAVLDAWLKGEDDRGWTEGPNAKIPAVNMLLRKGNPGFNKIEGDATFGTREEKSWPLERTEYRRYYPSSDLSLSTSKPTEESTVKLEALGKGEPVQFKYKFEKETEIAGHPLANLVVSVEKRADGTAPKDVDLFLTLRHFDAEGKEIYYTGELSLTVPLHFARLTAVLHNRNRW